MVRAILTNRWEAVAGEGAGHPGHSNGLVTGGRCRHLDLVIDAGRWFGSGYGEGQVTEVGVRLEGEGDSPKAGVEARAGSLADIRWEPGASPRDQTEPVPTWAGSYLRSPSALSRPAARSRAGPRRPAGPAP